MLRITIIHQQEHQPPILPTTHSSTYQPPINISQQEALQVGQCQCSQQEVIAAQHTLVTKAVAVEVVARMEIPRALKGANATSTISALSSYGSGDGDPTYYAWESLYSLL
mmetsp:Transcript_30395/g.49568  ORF Transcript_30395/g.49568 Transcript_30395/m.49568 type:complete len:110 (-) Transcript_30395:138-467(-)